MGPLPSGRGKAMSKKSEGRRITREDNSRTTASKEPWHAAEVREREGGH